MAQKEIRVEDWPVGADVMIYDRSRNLTPAKVKRHTKTRVIVEARGYKWDNETNEREETLIERRFFESNWATGDLQEEGYGDSWHGGPRLMHGDDSRIAQWRKENETVQLRVSTRKAVDSWISSPTDILKAKTARNALQRYITHLGADDA